MKKLTIILVLSVLLFSCKKEDCDKYEFGYLRIENRTIYNIGYACGMYGGQFIAAGETITISLEEGANHFSASIANGQGARNTWSADFITNSCEVKTVKLE